ncbi:MAG: GspH/FimT family pseudopilin [Pseudomonadota bacterium]|nr:GspH/FimT family pseudopilin [Pseudomonadota bacterium]
MTSLFHPCKPRNRLPDSHKVSLRQVESLTEVMRTHLSVSHARGVTLIELMVVVAILAIVLVVAIPSFTELTAKKRVEGALTELNTDLQFARSEAVQRNTNVRITFGTGCYVIHTVGSTGTTSCTQANAPTMATGAIEIKRVQLDATPTVSFSPNNGLTFLAFDNLRGMATWNGSNTTSGSVNITSSVGSWQLRTSVTAMGRTQTCSPNSSIQGYPACS